ncbi:MAG: lipid-A-disaccharide synthase [Rhizobiaceae bacterium]
MSRKLRIAIVAGEESGDLLGADLVFALAARTGDRPELAGVGGRHLSAVGLSSLFDSHDIALVGIASVIRDLPRLVRRIGATVDAIVAWRPDVLVTIDSPEFSLRVASRVRAKAPSIPIVHYVCPSVWAWRPGRASAMRPYVDRILCLLPFEPLELDRLGGPPATFVGHRLSRDPGMLEAQRAQATRNDALRDQRPVLLLLPGSRRAEVEGLLTVFREAAEALPALGVDPRVVIPTLPGVEQIVRRSVAAWRNQPEVVVGVDGKWRAFREATAALAASGTVTLELALAGVPLVSCYRLDPLARMLGPFVFKSWSASLPNLISGRFVVPEVYLPFLRADILARHIEPLLKPTKLREWQLDGFVEVRERLDAGRPAGEIAAQAVLETLASGAKAGGFTASR